MRNVRSVARRVSLADNAFGNTGSDLQASLLGDQLFARAALMRFALQLAALGEYQFVDLQAPRILGR